MGEEQRVEILKALFRGVDLLILDEPTAVLTPSETKELFENLRKLKQDGKTIVFISHKLDEVLAVADRITVLRRGKVVGETRPDDTSKQKLAEMMVGRPVLFRLEKPQVETGDPILEVSDLRYSNKINGVDLTVNAGEILGVAGVEGNGQRELGELIIGLLKPTGGEVQLNGKSLAGRSVQQIRSEGVAFVSEDRHERGLVLDMTLWENTMMGRQDDKEYQRGFGLIAIQKVKELCARLIQRFDVRARQHLRDRRDAVRREPAETHPCARARERPAAPHRRAADAGPRRRRDRIRMEADPRTER